MANPLFDALFAPLKGRHTTLLILPDGRTLSGDAFHGLIVRQTNALRALGVKPGDRIAAQTAKSPQSLALYGACTALGAVFLPLNPAYTDTEVAYFLTDATPRLLVCDDARRAGPSKAAPAIRLPMPSAFRVSRVMPGAALDGPARRASSQTRRRGVASVRK